jgi:hypothetical protein
MTAWDFLHAHAEGIGALIALFIILIFIKEINK